MKPWFCQISVRRGGGWFWKPCVLSKIFDDSCVLSGNARILQHRRQRLAPVGAKKILGFGGGGSYNKTSFPTAKPVQNLKKFCLERVISVLTSTGVFVGKRSFFLLAPKAPEIFEGQISPKSVRPNAFDSQVTDRERGSPTPNPVTLVRKIRENWAFFPHFFQDFVILTDSKQLKRGSREFFHHSCIFSVRKSLFRTLDSLHSTFSCS